MSDQSLHAGLGSFVVNVRVLRASIPVGPWRQARFRPGRASKAMQGGAQEDHQTDEIVARNALKQASRSRARMSQSCQPSRRQQTTPRYQAMPSSSRVPTMTRHARKASCSTPINRSAEQDRRRLDADLQIPRPIDHGVFGVVGEGPEQVADEPPEGWR